LPLAFFAHASSGPHAAVQYFDLVAPNLKGRLPGKAPAGRAVRSTAKAAAQLRRSFADWHNAACVHMRLHVDGFARRQGAARRSRHGRRPGNGKRMLGVCAAFRIESGG